MSTIYLLLSLQGETVCCTMNKLTYLSIFFYHERLIKCGKKEHGDNILYLFEDIEMKKEEEYTLYKQHDENKITSNTFNKGLEKAGKILIISDVDLAPEDIFLM